MSVEGSPNGRAVSSVRPPGVTAVVGMEPICQRNDRYRTPPKRDTGCYASSPNTAAKLSGSKRHGSKPVHGRHAGRTGDTPNRTLSNGHAPDMLTAFDMPSEQHEEVEAR